MKLNYRVVLLILATVFGLMFSLPTFNQNIEGKKITLGLDLQGGLHMLLGVKTDEAVNSQLKSIASSIKHFAEHNDILVEGISVADDKVVFELLDSDDATTMDEQLKTIEGTVVNAANGKYT
ncbi:MAG: protein translocase subunit SecD, partial [Sulfuricurvum sp.]